MNWDQIQGNWKQVMGKAREQWAKLTDDDLMAIEGHREKLAGKIQERYGIAKEEVEKQVSAWQTAAKDVWFGHDAGHRDVKPVDAKTQETKPV